MKTVVISYSLTGNNEALAQSVADALTAEHIKIAEQTKRTTGTIILDMILNRAPKVQPAPDILGKYDQILFVGPVWMGQAASPLRRYFRHIRENPRRYAFISISGGALNTNPKLAEDIKKRTGAEPVVIVDQHITDLLPQEAKPAMKETSAYKVSSEDLKKLTGVILKTAGEKLKNAG